MNRIDEPGMVSRAIRRWISTVLALILVAAGVVATSATRAVAEEGVTAEGTVSAWGSNAYGQASVPAGLTGVASLAAGWDHTLAMRADGTVAAWGSNAYGQTSVPAGLTGVVAIAAGRYHNLAVRDDGTVTAWGSSYYYGEQVSVPAGLAGVVAVAAGAGHDLALRGDGSVAAWGWNGSGEGSVPEGLAGIVAVSAGDSHNMALTAHGAVVAWGYNGHGQTDVPAGLTGVVTIAAGGQHCLAVKEDGTVIAWGDNRAGQTTVPAGLSDVIAVAAGASHSMALKKDGTVISWGDNGSQQTDVPAGLTGVVAIAAGLGHSVAVVGGAPSPGAGLSVSGISTTSGGNTGDLTVNIYGTGFAPGAVVKLIQAGQPDIVIANAMVRTFASGASVITPSIPLGGAALGGYSVLVTNPNGTAASLGQAFNVVQGGPALLGLSIIGPDRVRVNGTGIFHVSITNLAANGNNVDARLVIGDGFGGQLVDQLVTGIAPGMSQLVSFSATSSQEICKQFAGVARRTLACDQEKNALEAFSATQKWFKRLLLTLKWTHFGTCTDSTGAKITPATPLCDSLDRLIESMDRQLAVTSQWSTLWCLSLQDRCPNAPDCAGFDIDDYWPEPIYNEDLSDEAKLAAFAQKMTDSIVQMKAAYQGSGTYPGSSAQASKETCWVSSMDPNDKVGTSGCGPEGYVPEDMFLPYTINFENMPTATAPAADVTITDQLDPSTLDLDTFTLGGFTFGDRVVSPPDGVADFATEVDLRPSKNLLVRINTHLDRATGLVTWRFASIDPETGLTPEDPMLGFLPPNSTPPEGEGSVSFTVSPRTGLPTRTEIRNQAQIVFDTNEPIDTPVWLNTLDTDAPSSEVATLPDAQETAVINVQWSGNDTGSGVKNFTIWVSEDYGPWTVWLRDTPATSETYLGFPGRTYQFMSTASDHARNMEPWPSDADATIQILPPTPPVITPTVAGTQGSDGWFTADVTVTWQVTDDQSAIASTQGCDPANVTVDSSGTMLICGATSAGGRASQAVTVKRDATKPTVVWDMSGPADQASYSEGQVPPAPTCTDAVSGVAECAVTGYVTTVGTHTVSVTATDNAGNTATETRSYTVTAVTPPVVQYNVTPLYKLDKASKVGSTIPIKIQVHDAGKNVSNAGLKVRAVSLTMGATTTDAVPAPGNSRPDGYFAFDPALGDGGGYQFNVKMAGLTPGTWTLNFTIGDDQTPHGATFVVRN